MQVNFVWYFLGLIIKRNRKWPRDARRFFNTNFDNFFGNFNFTQENIEQNADFEPWKLKQKCEEKSLEIIKVVRLGLKEAVPLLGKTFL